MQYMEMNTQERRQYWADLAQQQFESPEQKHCTFYKVDLEDGTSKFCYTGVGLEAMGDLGYAVKWFSQYAGQDLIWKVHDGFTEIAEFYKLKMDDVLELVHLNDREDKTFPEINEIMLGFDEEFIEHLP